MVVLTLHVPSYRTLNSCKSLVVRVALVCLTIWLFVSVKKVLRSRRDVHDHHMRHPHRSRAGHDIDDQTYSDAEEYHRQDPPHRAEHGADPPHRAEHGHGHHNPTPHPNDPHEYHQADQDHEARDQGHEGHHKRNAHEDKDEETASTLLPTTEGSTEGTIKATTEAPPHGRHQDTSDDEHRRHRPSDDNTHSHSDRVADNLAWETVKAEDEREHRDASMHMEHRGIPHPKHLSERYRARADGDHSMRESSDRSVDGREHGRAEHTRGDGSRHDNDDESDDIQRGDGVQHRGDGVQHRGDVEHQRRDVDHHKGDVEQHGFDVEHHRDDVAHHRDDVEHQRGDVDQHRGDVDHHRGDVEHHRGDVEHHRGDVEHHRGDVEHNRGDGEHHRGDGEHHRGDVEHMDGVQHRAEHGEAGSRNQHHASLSPEAQLPADDLAWGGPAAVPHHGAARQIHSQDAEPAEVPASTTFSPHLFPVDNETKDSDRLFYHHNLSPVGELPQDRHGEDKFPLPDPTVRICSQRQRQLYLRETCRDLMDPEKEQEKYMNRRLKLVAINHKAKLLYCVLPKTGSRSWLNFMVNLSSDVDFDRAWQIRNPKFMERAGLEYKRKVYINDIEKLYKDYTKFVVVRHPLQRFVAAYYEAVIKNHNFKTKDGKLPTFREFATMMGRRKIHPQVQMARYINHCQVCRIKYDYILKTETIDSDFHMLSSDLGTNVPLPRDHVNKVFKARHHSDMFKYDALLQTLQPDYTDTLKDLMAVYKTDIKVFGYGWDYDNRRSTCAAMQGDKPYSCC